MIIPTYFISCDWGTTNFRVRLVETNSLKVIAEHQTKQGVRRVYEKFLEQKEYTQTQFFSNYLKEQLKSFPTEHQNYPVVIAGMASANIGLKELSYANLPINPLENDLVWESLVLENGLEVILISGVKSSAGMMRGEEIQAVGLADLLAPYKNGILLLPGTHSKHITLKNNCFTALKTYMTGELFEILSQKSILSNSIIKEDKDNISETSFLKGVKLGSEGKLAESLFSVRVNDIFGTTTKEDNYFFLSGLLLGDELAYLKTEKRKIVLAAPATLSNLYKTALDEILGSKNYVFLENTIVENAILVGQKKILESYE